MSERPDGADRLRYPGGWVRAMTYEATAAQLRHARFTASRKVADALEVMEYAQPPHPADPLADQGATYGQLRLVAECYGMSEPEANELISIAERVGISARHAALMVGTGLQRRHEIGELNTLLNDPAAEAPAGETEG